MCMCVCELESFFSICIWPKYVYGIVLCIVCVEQYSSVFNMVWHNRRHNVWTRGAFHKNGWWATHRARYHSGGHHSAGQHSGGQHIRLDTIEQRGKRKPLRRHRSSSPQREPPLLYITLRYNWKGLRHKRNDAKLTMMRHKTMLYRAKPDPLRPGVGHHSP